jgi:MFS family permease
VQDAGKGHDVPGKGKRMQRHYGWVVVAAGALLGCVGMGSLFSLAVFLDPIIADTGWSKAGVSAAMTVGFLAMGVGSFVWGAISDRYGPRVIGLAGAVLLSVGLLLASRAQTLLEFQLAYGLAIGAAAGAFFAPMMATASGWFERHRALAVSLVSAGLGMAPMVVAPFGQWLLSGYPWREAQALMAAAALALTLPLALLLRRPPIPTGAAALPQAPGQLRRALASRPFLVLATTFLVCCIAHSGPIFHAVSYALACGVPAMTAVSVYSMQGLGGLGGRVIFALLADRFGAKLVLTGGLLLQAAAIGAFIGARSLGELYAVATIFGLAYGGVMPLYAVLAREYFGARIMGAVFGAATMVSSLGMAAGPAIGGWIFDRFGDYAGMYIGSALVGLGAVAIALTFPPLARKVRLQPA